ncbi:hypothetical protein EV363DRAFT_1398273 [Boletus edulis]|nr:hypothetical protein EV363DRAFT_1398273 [Boletus edulis]
MVRVSLAYETKGESTHVFDACMRWVRAATMFSVLIATLIATQINGVLQRFVENSRAHCDGTHRGVTRCGKAVSNQYKIRSAQWSCGVFIYKSIYVASPMLEVTQNPGLADELQGKQPLKFYDNV